MLLGVSLPFGAGHELHRRGPHSGVMSIRGYTVASFRVEEFSANGLAEE